MPNISMWQNAEEAWKRACFYLVDLSWKHEDLFDILQSTSKALQAEIAQLEAENERVKAVSNETE